MPDVIAPGLRVLFCGINPSLYTAAAGHHFARPGNRFWPSLWKAGFTDRLLRPSEERELLRFGCGITNLVARPTASAAELTRDELRRGAKVLERKTVRFAPHIAAILGVDAYRKAFERARAEVGLQEEKLGGSRLWVLPNPSGLNAHYQIDGLVAAYRALREDADKL